MSAAASSLAEARRIALLGIGGSGKSTLSVQLAARTGLPLFHMDQVFWKPGWEEVPEEEYLPRQAELVAQDSWIIEGFIDGAMRIRAERADLVIWLDYPGTTCLPRVLHRWWRHRHVARPDLGHADMREQIAIRFWWSVLTRGERPGIVAALRDVPDERVIRIRSPRALAAWMADQA